MYRLCLLLLVAIAAGTGCRMCASPYDYCGPVVDDCCCGNDYQPSIPYEATTAPGMPQRQIEPEPVYYEGQMDSPAITARQQPAPAQRVPAAKLPRQAKRPGSPRVY